MFYTINLSLIMITQYQVRFYKVPLPSRPGPTAAILHKEKAFYWLKCSTQNAPELIQPIEGVY